MCNFKRDPEIWTKSAEQKEQWKNVRQNFKSFEGWCSPKKRSPLVGKLVIYNEKMPTASYTVRQDEIVDILSKCPKIIKCEWLERTFTLNKLIEFIN